MPLVTSQFIRSYICANLKIFKDFSNGNNTLKYAPYVYDTLFNYEKDYDLKNLYRDMWD